MEGSCLRKEAFGTQSVAYLYFFCLEGLECIFLNRLLLFYGRITPVSLCGMRMNLLTCKKNLKFSKTILLLFSFSFWCNRFNDRSHVCFCIPHLSDVWQMYIPQAIVRTFKSEIWGFGALSCVLKRKICLYFPKTTAFVSFDSVYHQFFSIFFPVTPSRRNLSGHISVDIFQCGFKFKFLCVSFFVAVVEEKQCIFLPAKSVSHALPPQPLTHLF